MSLRHAAGDLDAERVLFDGEATVGTCAGAEPENESTSGDLLCGRRGHRQQPGVAVGDVRDKRTELHARGYRGERSEQCEALEHGVAAEDVPRKMVEDPHRAEAGFVGDDRRFA